MPKERLGIQFSDWPKQYVVPNSPNAVFELLDKRSVIYWESAMLPMAGELSPPIQEMALRAPSQDIALSVSHCKRASGLRSHVRRLVPWAYFKRQARERRWTMENLRDGEYEVIEWQVRRIRSELRSKTTSSAAHQLSCIPIVSTIESFFLFMSLYPEIQCYMQEELDRVVGPNRLPDFDDRLQLLYVEAIIREIYRWNPVAPLALPLKLIADDVHEGYFLSAGSVIFANTWGILHNPDVYLEPVEFKPERFLTEQSNGFNPDPQTARTFVSGSCWVNETGHMGCPGERIGRRLVICYGSYDLTPRAGRMALTRDTLCADYPNSESPTASNIVFWDDQLHIHSHIVLFVIDMGVGRRINHEFEGEACLDVGSTIAIRFHFKRMLEIASGQGRK
ncbi:cytochrome P450 [Obba rivulosa]|uniref:Cytochrome P450 n=1 Tax=Obba rivulosa TaxID=1052685 RepID=A0A8E2DN38_9APHY|nr:cytochrome P450 [Obba rivulosa]